MFERFSDDARQAVAFASDEARELRHGRIETEHILLGLLRGADTTAGEALALGRNEIDTEHVLLGRARENAGLASRILDDLGAGPERIRAETLARRPQARERRRHRRKPWAFSSGTSWQYLIEDTAGPAAEERLNQLGEEGSELVVVLPAEAGGGLVFKRPRRLIRAREAPPPEPDPAA